MAFTNSHQQNAYAFVNRFFEIKAHLLMNRIYPNKLGYHGHPEVGIANVEIVAGNPSHVENESMDLSLDQTTVDQKAPEGNQTY